MMEGIADAMTNKINYFFNIFLQKIWKMWQPKLETRILEV